MMQVNFLVYWLTYQHHNTFRPNLAAYQLHLNDTSTADQLYLNDVHL